MGSVTAQKSSWTIEKAEKLYNVPYWACGFFHINTDGHVEVWPRRSSEHVIDLKKLVEELEARGIQLPILLRFSDVLRERMRELNHCFARSIEEFAYRAPYRGVYPIKVNQQKHVVQSIVSAGKEFHYGLEAGSKPELLTVLSLIDDPEALLICNGYKDEEYIELALLGLKLGIQVVLVVEKYSELETIFKVADRLGVRPVIGIRARLAARGSGRWQASGGDRSKFGLSSVEIMDAVRFLREKEALDCLRLLHYHIGSQINAISPLRDSLREAGRFYIELRKMGAGLTHLDVGGGLAVDYDGSRTNSQSSANYSVQEYTNTVVYEIATMCNSEGIEHPTLITEAGRALTAFHSVLVTNVLEVVEVPSYSIPECEWDDAPLPVIEMREACEYISEKNFQEAWHDINYTRRQILDLFSLGHLSLEWRAVSESIYWTALHKIWQISKKMPYPHDELENLESELSDMYFCNMSIFQSLPDSWAIEQIFPIMPLQKLHIEPDRNGVLVDISCDSDGKIDKFADVHTIRRTLPLHRFRADEPYLIGFFLIGAYQEILGDLHNLFGDNNAVHIAWDDDTESYSVEHVEEGDTVTEVLNYVQHSRDELISRFREKTEHALRRKKISVAEARHIIRMYRDGFDGYTYPELFANVRAAQDGSAFRASSAG